MSDIIILLTILAFDIGLLVALGVIAAAICWYQDE